MKNLLLWQKVYLSVIAVLLLAMVILSVSLISVNFNTSLEVSINNGIYRHNVIVDSIKNKIAYQQMSTNVLHISNDDFKKIVDEIWVSETEDISICKDKIMITNKNKVNEKIKSEFATISLSAEKDYYAIKNTDEKYLLFTVSNANFLTDEYMIISSYDITAVYLASQKQSYLCIVVCIVSALLISLVLFFIIKLLFAPLKKVQCSINEIAMGNYTVKIPVTSQDEIAQLAQSTNIMSSAIKENIQKVEQLADSRKHFIDNLSHEMKTPLTSILGYADMLRISADIGEEKRIQYASVIVDETKRLKALSNKLMELISIENYSLNEIKPISVKELFDEVFAVISPMAKSKNITIVVKSIHDEIQIDILLFKSMVLNLLDNAIKATPEGGKIELSSNISNNLIFIEIKDYGSGIKKEEIEKITEPFYMIDKSRSRKKNGAGLGLSLFKKIAELHHAELKFDSEIGQGTKAIIILKRESDCNE